MATKFVLDKNILAYTALSWPLQLFYQAEFHTTPKELWVGFSLVYAIDANGNIPPSVSGMTVVVDHRRPWSLEVK